MAGDRVRIEKRDGAVIATPVGAPDDECLRALLEVVALAASSRLPLLIHLSELAYLDELTEERFGRLQNRIGAEDLRCVYVADRPAYRAAFRRVLRSDALGFVTMTESQGLAWLRDARPRSTALLSDTLQSLDAIQRRMAKLRPGRGGPDQ